MPHDRRRRGSFVWCFLAFLAEDARADSKQSTVLSMDYLEGETIHLADQGGAINRHAAASVDVELFSTNSKLIVSDRGERSEHNLYETFSTDEKTAWRNLWTGRWSLDGDVMRLDLTLEKQACTHTKQQSGAAPENLPCRSWSKRVELRCTATQVTVEDPDRAAHKVPAWQCAPAGQVDLGETPSSWVLGRPGCVQTVGGRRAASAGYRGCADRSRPSR